MPVNDAAKVVFLEDRYVICPQLATYDHLLPTLAPYLTFASPRNYQSAVVNIDGAGFRVSRIGGGAATIDTTTWPAGRPGGIVLGNSFAFGVGASSDGETLVSHLNAIMPYAFLNLGIRTGNSTQELVAAIPFLERAQCIVVCSGINNLLVNLQSLGVNELFGPFFGEGAYETLRERPLSEVVETSSGIELKRLTRQVLQRLWSRTTRRWREPQASGNRFGAAGWDAHFTRALELQRRDLRVLARARRPDSTLLFAAQPFAPCCVKTLSPEERSLFEISDQLDDSAWHGVRDALTELWPRYVSALQQICVEEDIAFTDLGTRELKGWSFVDRVHMTDDGYRHAADFLATQLSLFRCVS